MTHLGQSRKPSGRVGAYLSVSLQESSQRERGSDRHRLQRERQRLPGQPVREERRGTVPVRDGGGDDPRVEPGGERHRRAGRRRPFERGRRLQGARDRERPAVRDRPPRRSRGRLRLVLHARPEAARLQGREGAQGIRAVRHPGAQTATSSSRTPSRTPRPRTTSPSPARPTSTSSRPTASSSPESSTAARRTRR